MSMWRVRHEKKENITDLVLVDLTNTKTGNSKQVLTKDDYQAVTQELVMFATMEGVSASAIDIEISKAP